jgi:hypothetical protein
LLSFGGSKASTSRSFLEKFQFKQRGWAVHFIDLTSLLRLKRGAGRAVKARLVDSKRAASTYYSYQNEKQQAERRRSEPLSEKVIAR